MENKGGFMNKEWKKDTPGIFAEVLFLLFVLLKPLYLRPSGNIGLADICLALSGIILLIREIRQIVTEQHKDSGRSIFREIIRGLIYPQDIPWYFFLFCVIMIDLIWYRICGAADFLIHMIFWVYNGFAIWIWRRLADDGPVEGFHGHVFWVLKLDILIQFLILLAGRGRVLVEPWGATRYTGTFNDPNQLAFFLFTAVLLIYLNEIKRNRKPDVSIFSSIICAILALIVIIATKSTGIMLGLCLFYFLLWCCSVQELVQRGRISGKLVAAMGILILLAVTAILVLIWPEADFNVQTVEYNTLTRFQEKLWKLSNGGLADMILDRGADKILAYPRYLLFGAGEGTYERFAAAGPVNEIHSSLLSILFCYGIIPTAAMLVWFWNTLKQKNRWQLCACIALIIECLLLVNYRQPLFWFVFLA